EVDARFTRVITLDGKLRISGSLLNDMLFLRGERQTRFAFGTAGVFWTEDFGVEWFPIVNSIALPGRPESGFFDAISDPNDRALCGMRGQEYSADRRDAGSAAVCGAASIRPDGVCGVRILKQRAKSGGVLGTELNTRLRVVALLNAATAHERG